MLKAILQKLENPDRPLLGPNVKALEFWGLLLPKNTALKYLYIFLHITIIVFTATEYVDIWFIKSDINMLLENLKITMLATVSVIKVTTILLFQNKWLSIIEYVTRSDLKQRETKDDINKAIINKFTKYCRITTYLYWSLMYTTVAVVMVQPIFKYVFSPSYKDNVRTGKEAYLQVVSSWVPFDKSTVIGYLGACAIQSYAAVYGGGWITSFDTNAIVIMVFFRGELELLRRDSAAIFGSGKEAGSDAEAKARLKECHRRHVELVRYSQLFDSCLSPIMLFYMFVCSVMLCVTAYQITHWWKLVAFTSAQHSCIAHLWWKGTLRAVLVNSSWLSETNMMQLILQVEYLVFGVSQLFLYCWHSNDVLYISQGLLQGPYESAWWSRKVLRKDLALLIAQFRKEIVFSAGPFAKLTVPTFISILKGAYSYYTLLNQSQVAKK